MDVYTFDQGMQAEPALPQGVSMPPIPKALLARIAWRKSREADARTTAAFAFAQANRDLKVWLSQMATVDSEAKDAEDEYRTFASRKRKTRSHYPRKDADSSRPLTPQQRLMHFGLFLCFFAALAFVAFSTANFVIEADIYPALKGNILAACFTTGIVVTVFIGGPIVLYSLIETDEDRSRFARRITYTGLILGFTWVFLFACVDALDNYITLTLSEHPFKGDLRFLNSLLPALKDGAKFLMIPSQILGEAAGSVAIELYASAFRDAGKTITMEPKQDFANLRDSSESARKVAVERRREAAHLVALREEFDAGLAMFIAQSVAWLDAYDEEQEFAGRAGKQKSFNNIVGDSHA